MTPWHFPACMSCKGVSVSVWEQVSASAPTWPPCRTGWTSRLLPTARSCCWVLSLLPQPLLSRSSSWCSAWAARGESTHCAHMHYHTHTYTYTLFTHAHNNSGNPSEKKYSVTIKCRIYIFNYELTLLFLFCLKTLSCALELQTFDKRKICPNKPDKYNIWL